MAKRYLLLGLVAIVILAGCAGMTSKKELGKVWVKVGQAHVRSSATIDSKAVAIVEKGDKLKVLGRRGSWYKVKVSMKETGWIHRSVVTPTKSRAK